MCTAMMSVFKNQKLNERFIWADFKDRCTRYMYTTHMCMYIYIMWDFSE